jgi:hypothetical protein
VKNPKNAGGECVNKVVMKRNYELLERMKNSIITDVKPCHAHIPRLIFVYNIFNSKNHKTTIPSKQLQTKRTDIHTFCLIITH